MRLNVKVSDPVFTHEGAVAYPHMTAEQRLRRSLLSCLLWEREFYEDGQSIADRIVENAKAVPVGTLAALAIEARSEFNLRHAPLLLLAVLAKQAPGTALVSDTIAATIQRADELSEFLAIYAQANGVTPDKIKPKLSHQVRKGLAKAFTKFDAYQLGKYDRAGAVRLRDALFLCHAKPKDEAQAELWKLLVADKLESPDTWEVSLSAGADKKATFERLLRDGKLGYLALLRNLRNMAQANVDTGLVREAILARKGADRVLPFRYIAAARAAPQFEPFLDQALSEGISRLPALPGKTAILVDVSGSMSDKLSAKSDLARVDAAAALASIVHGDVRMFSFSDNVVEVPPRRGMAGVDSILNSQPRGGTALFDAVALVNRDVPYDRLIVVTDEQASAPDQLWGMRRIQGNIRTLPDPKGLGYMINVASAQNGVGYGKWCHIDGFSERVLGFIHEHESARAG